MNNNGIMKKQGVIFQFIMAATTLLLLAACDPEQVPDKSYIPSINSSAYTAGNGPQVCVDEAHNNFHTLDHRFWAFGELLRRDGYRVQATTEPFSAAVLGRCDILVISNAQLEGEWDMYPRPTPSAFTVEEIESVRAWVHEGGALLLIADHMPLAGVAAKLASAFGVEFNDGFAVAGFEGEENREAALGKPTIFSTESMTLVPSLITKGRMAEESVTSVRSFSGQAFQAPAYAQPVLVLPADFVSLMPEKAWVFDENTKSIPVGGWLQGAVMPFGAGRAAFFGEAAMFTAQLSGSERIGMNAPMAEENHQLVLNVMHWLSGILDGTAS